MATSVESPSPASLHKGPSIFMGSSSQMFSPSSDKRFWSSLRSRVDTLLENQSAQMNSEALDHGRRLKDDSTLLMRGFDSVAESLSQLSNNLETALEGARNLAKTPKLSEILHATLEKAKNEEEAVNEESKAEHKQEGYIVDNNRRLKRKLDSEECSDDQEEENLQEANQKDSKEMKNMKKAKNLAMAMATRAASMARELKSIRSDMAFMQERCSLLEEENRTLRDGVGVDDDDLVRLQLEALLAEKSRLANENANLTRENQCLHQLVEYHQLTSQETSASYENLLSGMCLDFSSPRDADGDEGSFSREFKTPHADLLGFSKSLDECFYEEEQE